MKSGLNLLQLATRIHEEQEAKRDFVADTRQLQVITGEEAGLEGGKGIAVSIPSGTGPQVFSINRNAERQLAQRLKIPQPFFDRMSQSHPDLLAHTVNGLFQREPEKRLVRTLHGSARAFLSDRYRMMDNLELMEAVLPVLREVPNMLVESMDVTPDHLYLKAFFPSTELEVKPGDVVRSGILISNSEVGAGSLSVRPMVFRLVCKNGLIADTSGHKKYHVGRQTGGSEEEALEIFRDETLAADDKALWMKVQDVVRASLNSASFEGIVGRMRDAQGVKLTGKLEKVVELTAKRMGHSEGEAGGILRHLIEGGDLSMYGLMNAVTRFSQDVESYERATDLERDGGRIIELPSTEWLTLAHAA